MTCKCGKKVPTNEAVAYGKCEDCWVPNYNESRVGTTAPCPKSRRTARGRDAVINKMR